MGFPTNRAQLTAGTVLGERYELLAPLGSGGMAEVWKARDHSLNRLVAIKVLHPHLADDASFVGRFRREALAAARLTHPNIVAVYDTISGSGLEAIVMELVDGPTLRQHIDGHGPITESEAVDWGSQLCDALDCAHRNNIVHRDLKPANILICRDSTVRLVDFGIAKASDDPDVTVVGTLIGTATYLAPEQVEGAEVDARTDIYSLATVLYEAVSGTVPFSGDSSSAIAVARLHQTPTDLTTRSPHLSSSFSRAIMVALERSPEDRFATAHQFRAALHGADLANSSSRILDETTVLATSMPTTVQSTPPNIDAPRSDVNDHTGRIDRGHSPIDNRVDDSRHSDHTTRSRKRRQRIRFGSLVSFTFLVGPVLLVGLLIAVASKVREPDVPEQEVARPLQPTSAVAIDPFGDQEEHNDRAQALIDGNTKTAWTTESYRDPAFGSKPGVGIRVSLSTRAALEELVIESTPGWSGRVFVSDLTTRDLTNEATLTALLGSSSGIPFSVDRSSSVVTLGAQRGTMLLVWIDTLSPASGSHQVSIGELRLTGRTNG